MVILDILNVIISLCFIYFLASSFTSWLTEKYSTWRKRRSTTLKKILRQMLGAPAGQATAGDTDEKKEKINLYSRFWAHSIITELGVKGGAPVHIPVKDFCLVIMDLLHQAGGKKNRAMDLETIKKGINKIDTPAAKERLSTFAEASDLQGQQPVDELAAFKKYIHDWHQTMMEKATHIYKNKTRILTALFGLLLAAVINIDAIKITRMLWQDATLKNAISNTAQEYFNENPDKKEMDLKTIQEQVGKLDIPVGWNSREFEGKFTVQDDDNMDSKKIDVKQLVTFILYKILGILISGYAIGRGSPFWYDILKRILSAKG